MASTVILLLLMAVFAGTVKAQVNSNNTRQPRILLIVDASSSMLQPWGDKDSRFQVAGRIVAGLMDSIYAVNNSVEFGLRVYGHQSPAQNNDCYDSKEEVMFSKNNWTQMQLRLASIKPFGVSPIAYSLSEAAQNDLTDVVHNAYSIILITDGGESCGGDICDVVRKLIEDKIYFKPYIIGLVDYAPLKDQYNCLGKYLQVVKEQDIAPAIDKIVADYRPLLRLPIMVEKEKPIVVKVTPKAEPIVVEVPKPKPEPVIVEVPKPKPIENRTPEKAIPKVVVAKPENIPTKVTAPIITTAPKPIVAAVTKAPKEIQTLPFPLKHGSLHRLPFALTRYTVSKPDRMDRPVAFVKKDSVRQAQTTASISTRDVVNPVPVSASAPLVKTTTTRIPSPVVKKDSIAVPPPPPPKTTVVIRPMEPLKSTVKIKPLPNSIENTKPVETGYTVKTEDAKETTLSILFTDGHGKFYASTPQLQLLDAATGKLVKQFYRTVDASGNPDPQIIPAGNYNLLVVGRTNMLMRSIKVEANKKNSVTVKVTNGTLRFRYAGAPGRPVEEFDAIVTIRFEPGPTVRQHCTQELDYPPGNYYIEVNTLPVSRFNTDIDFGSTTEIQILQSGYVQFTNTEPIGTVQLYTPLGNKFLRFHGLNITGNPADQRLRLRPGHYEVHWIRNPKIPMASEEVVKFKIESNSVTEVYLR
ncbi:MAG: hypothetical protein ABI378_13590 [Chitinophagaceae bacterium]